MTLDLRDPAVRVKLDIMDKSLHELIQHRGWARSRAILQAAELDQILGILFIWELFAGCYLIIMGKKPLPEALSTARELTDSRIEIYNTAMDLYKADRHLIYLTYLLHSKCANKIDLLRNMLNECYESGYTFKVSGLFAHFSKDIWTAARSMRDAKYATYTKKAAPCLFMTVKRYTEAKKSKHPRLKSNTNTLATLPGNLDAFTEPDLPLPAITFACPAVPPTRVAQLNLSFSLLPKVAFGPYAASVAGPPQLLPKSDSALISLISTETFDFP